MDPVNVQIQLQNIHCFDEGDFIGSAEPYLWTVFFKIDGDTALVDESLTLHGTATVVGTPGNHGNLPSHDVDAGNDVSIPGQIGEFHTVLKPIPLQNPIGTVKDVSGAVGCIAILMEEDDTPNSAIAAGHDALNNAVQTALNNLIPKLKKEPTDTETEALTKEVSSAVEDAIGDNTSVWDWISAAGNMDDKIGSKVFRFSQQELLDAGPGGVVLSERWQNEGDWQITGRIYVKWSEWEDLGGILTSAPAAASWQENRLDCFVRGTNTHMWHKWWDGSAWSGWEDLGGGLSSAPAAASRQENRLDCFVRGTDNHMWYKWWDGSAWSDWEDLGGILADDPAAVSWGPNRVDCFVRGTNNHMWHKWWG